MILSAHDNKSLHADDLEYPYRSCFSFIQFILSASQSLRLTGIVLSLIHH